MANKRIFVVLPPSDDFFDVLEAVGDAVSRVGEQLQQQLSLTAPDTLQPSFATERYSEPLAAADLVIADITSAEAEVLTALGFVQALGKPIVLIAERQADVPSPFKGRFMVLYDRRRLIRDLVPHLADAIIVALRHPDRYTPRGQERLERDVPRAFVSYSHADQEALKRLLVHLRPLEKKGVVEVWSDTKIKAGQRWREEISNALSRSGIAVLLISADFLASDFIVDNELPPLLRDAEEKGTRILPVVLKPCSFERDERLSVFQAINSPSEPLLSLSDIEQERVWDDVALAVEKEIGNSRS